MSADQSGVALPVEVIAAALWNIEEGYSVRDNAAIGKGPFDWIPPTATNPDDVKQRTMFLGYAAAVLGYLEEAGWVFARDVDEDEA